MRTSFWILILGIVTIQTFAQKGWNMTYESSWIPSIPNVVMNDIWGYHDTSQGEFAIIGSTWGTHFVDVTVKDSIYEVQSFIGGNTSATWRDFKTAKHYAFGVSDDPGSSLQIFDLQYLPDSVVKVYDNDSLSERTHNIHIFGDRLYLIDNKGTHPGGGIYRNSVAVVDISNPLLPRRIGVLNDPQYNAGHDAYVRNDTVFLSVMFSATKAGLQVIDFTDPQNPLNIGSLTSYPDMGLNHASWGSEDGKTMVMVDETHGSAVKVLDISDVSNILVKSTFETDPNAIAHNPFILDSLAILSYYHEGVQIWDIQDPANPVHVGGYDTDTLIGGGGNYAGYQGCWGVYPFFPSRNIIASDRSNGLYVVTMDWYTPPPPPPPPTSLSGLKGGSLKIYPNPSNSGFVNIAIPESASNSNVEIFDLAGNRLLQNSGLDSGTVTRLDLSEWGRGIFLVKVSSGNYTEVRKLILK